MADEMVFTAEIGRPFWSALIVMFAIFAVVAVMIGYFVSQTYAIVALIIVIIIFAIVALYIPMYMRYTFNDDCLEVRGYGTTCIPYNSIVNVNETDSIYNNTFGWPLTIDRVEIIYDNKHSIYYVSPKDRKGFLDELKKRSPYAKYADVREKK